MHALLQAGLWPLKRQKYMYENFLAGIAMNSFLIPIF
jgi:hypothetical protein